MAVILPKPAVCARKRESVMSIHMYARDYEKTVQALTPGANLTAGTNQTAGDAFTTLLNLMQAAEKRESQKTAQTIQTGDPGMEAAFSKAADTYRVSVDLLKAVGKAESGFRSDAVSRSGAVGVMQLMPATARGLGVGDPYDMEQNIMGGAKFLSSLLDRYDGNVELALAAYNAGPANVDKYGGVPPFKETQNYIPKVLAYAGEGGKSSASQNPPDAAGAALGEAALAQSGLADLSGNAYGNPYLDLDIGNISMIVQNNPQMAQVIADLLKYKALSSFGDDEVNA